LEPEGWADVERLPTDEGAWLAGLLRLEAGPLAAEQIADALGRRISYSPGDLVLVDWGAAVVVDRDCVETLRTLEFANLQLLEFRLIDRGSTTAGRPRTHPLARQTPVALLRPLARSAAAGRRHRWNRAALERTVGH
jgi:hypothetical protein